jgi:hypothetical protein
VCCGRGEDSGWTRANRGRPVPLGSRGEHSASVLPEPEAEPRPPGPCRETGSVAPNLSKLVDLRGIWCHTPNQIPPGGGTRRTTSTRSASSYQWPMDLQVGNQYCQPRRAEVEALLVDKKCAFSYFLFSGSCLGIRHAGVLPAKRSADSIAASPRSVFRLPSPFSAYQYRHGAPLGGGRRAVACSLQARKRRFSRGTAGILKATYICQMATKWGR